MPAVSKFIDGTGPVFSGNLFPFLFITIACGAVSGFHALVSSGTTPKMIEQEGHAQPIGYGAMLMESFVAAMAMIAACVLTPGTYFAINSPAALIGTDVSQAAQVISSWGFAITPNELKDLAVNVGEQNDFITYRWCANVSDRYGIYFLTSNRWNGHDGILVSFCDSL